jgi:hypothetical protein
MSDGNMLQYLLQCVARFVFWGLSNYPVRYATKRMERFQIDLLQRLSALFWKYGC